MDFSQVEKQLKALGQDVYELARMKWNPAKNRPMSLSDLLTVEEIREKQSRIEIEMKNEENWYLRADPRPGIKHEVIFIDDNTPDGRDFLKNQGVIPACVVQTSTRSNEIPSLHCWYRMPTALDVQTRKAVEKVLLNRLHTEFPHDDPKMIPGDFGSNDGCHRGRLAGTWNFGLGKKKDCEIILLEASGHVLSDEITAVLLEEAKHFINYAPKIKLSDSLLEIENRKYENPKVVQWFTENIVPKMDAKKPHYFQDLFAARMLLRANFSEIDTKKVLLEHDPNPIFERKRDPAFFLENILREARKSLLPQASPSIPHHCGGEVLVPFRELASALPSAPAAPAADSDSGASAPDTKFFGYIENGKIFFNVNPKKNGTSTFPTFSEKSLLPQSIPNENPDKKTPFTQPRRKSHGVKPRAT